LSVALERAVRLIIVNCFVDQESLTPAELSRKVGMSTEAVTSLRARTSG
jgi:hypothetical protein